MPHNSCLYFWFFTLAIYAIVIHDHNGGGTREGNTDVVLIVTQSYIIGLSIQITYSPASFVGKDLTYKIRPVGGH